MIHILFEELVCQSHFVELLSKEMFVLSVSLVSLHSFQWTQLACSHAKLYAGFFLMSIHKSNDMTTK